MTDKKGFDEMQTQRRDRIGHQMFMLLFWVLFLNGTLHSSGIRWLEYPVNVMVISTACMAIYLVRVIAANAYLPPREQNRKAMLNGVVALVVSIIVLVVASLLLKNSPLEFSGVPGDSSHLILVIVSVTGLILALRIAIIKRANDKDDKDK